MFDFVPRHLIQRYGHLLVLIGIVLLFILGLLPTTILWGAIKTIVFLGVVSFAFLYFTNNSIENGSDEIPEEEPSADEDWPVLENEEDIDRQFNLFLDATLSLIKNVLVADSVVLLFANYPKKTFTIRHTVSDKSELILREKAFEIKLGLPGILIHNRTPIIENHLPEGHNILPYYYDNEQSSRSFVGVPVYFNDFIIGVICADTRVEEAYSNDDLDILKQFAQILSIQLFSSNKLYEYKTENSVGNTLFEISNEMNRVQSQDGLWDYLIHKIPQILPCDRLSISLKVDEMTGEILRLEGGTGNLRKGSRFSLSEGIVGWIMRKKQSLLVEDFSSKENYVPRFTSDEFRGNDYFSLLGVPVSVDNSMLAAICLESRKTKNFDDEDKKVLQTIANQAAVVHKILLTVDNLKRYNYCDEETGLDNLTAFGKFLPKEIMKASGLGFNLDLVVIKTSFTMKEESETVHHKAIDNFLSLILPYISETGYIFRLFPDLFGIVLESPGPRDIMEYAGTLKQKVKGNKIWADGSVTDFDILIGVIRKQFLTSDVNDTLSKIEQVIAQAETENDGHAAVFVEGPVN